MNKRQEKKNWIKWHARRGARSPQEARQNVKWMRRRHAARMRRGNWPVYPDQTYIDAGYFDYDEGVLWEENPWPWEGRRGKLWHAGHLKCYYDNGDDRETGW